MTVELRPYQVEAIEAVRAAKAAGNTRTIISLPTGCGKTITGLSLAKKIGGRTLWMAHRDELISQPLRALRAVWPEATAGVVKAMANEVDRQVVFASVPTIQSEKRLVQLLAPGPFDLVVADECHHAVAESWRRVLKGTGTMTPGGPLLVGLTATPERTDQAALEEVFEKVAYQYHLKQAIEAGYLVPPRVVRERINVNLDDVGKVGGDYNQGELDIAMMEAGIVDAVSAAVARVARRRKSLVFLISVRQAVAVAEMLASAGLRAAVVHGETPIEERRKILSDFAAKKLDVVCNCMVLTEGFDDPSVDCIVMARPTLSKSLYIQCVGRGLRIAPGKSDCLVVDMVGASERHSLVHAGAIFGLSEQGEYEDVLEDEEEISEEELLKQDPIEYWKRRYKSQMDGLGGGSRSEINWLAVNPKIYAMPCGQYGTVVLRKVGDEYMVEVVGRKDGVMREVLTSTPVDLELAQGIAEDYRRRVGEVSISSTESKWRRRSASDKQVEALKKFGIDVPSGLPSGVASDIITAHMAASWMYEPATPKQLSALSRMGVPYAAHICKGEARKLINKNRWRG